MIVLRVDDVSPTTSHDKLYSLLELLEEYDVKSTFAVIPKRESEWKDETIDIIREISKKHEIASHGLTHKCNLLPEPEYSSKRRVLIHHRKHDDPFHEFVCLDYGPINVEIQAEWLMKSKEILEKLFKTKITSFVPPQHLYDNNTLKAMKRAGLDTISIERHHVAPWKESDIFFVPMNTEDIFSHYGVLYEKPTNSKDLFEALKSRFLYRHSTMKYFGFYIHIWNFDEIVLRKFFEITRDIEYLRLKDVKRII